MPKVRLRKRISSLTDTLARRLGYVPNPAHRPKLKQPIPAGSKLHVGCGEQQLDGYFNCDLRDLEHVQLVCRAWEVSQHCHGLDEIFSRHMLEHLTYAEAKLTLRDWHNALAEGGRLHIEVPNLNFAFECWRRAEWSEEQLNQRFSDASWGFAGLFGWQRECDPEAADYNQTYWDVHKSGYTAESMRFFLEDAGFDNISIQHEGFTPAQLRRRNLAPDASDDCHLIAIATKDACSRRKAA